MSVEIPERYQQLRVALPFDEVAIGYGSIELTPVDGLEAMQQGYGVVRGGEPAGWRDGWVVIGTEGLCGDPIFIDANEPEYPVYTAAHGEGGWTPRLIAASFQNFVQILQRLQKLAVGRATPLELEKNPLTDEEWLAFIDFVVGDDLEVDTDFWEALCES